MGVARRDTHVCIRPPFALRRIRRVALLREHRTLAHVSYIAPSPLSIAAREIHVPEEALAMFAYIPSVLLDERSMVRAFSV